MKKWKCTVCGYIHEGEQPPEECPLCKAPKEKFVEVLPEGARRRWRCTVCGYIHEGEQPPEECPLCKAPKEKFEELTVAEPAPAKSSPPEVAAAPVVTSSRRWRCLVCGHTHQGPTPPPTCPVCKAPADQFGEIDPDGNLIRSAATAAASAAAAAAVAPRPGIFARMIMALHLHPISVHFPNGLLPVVLVFLAASVFLKFGVLAEAAYFNMIFVLATMPLVLLTGYIEWQKRYRGARSFLFLTKITCSMVVTVSLIVLVVWRYIDPAVAQPDSPNRLIYLIIAAVMVGAAGIAGHLGGHLVFSSRGR